VLEDDYAVGVGTNGFFSWGRGRVIKPKISHRRADDLKRIVGKDALSEDRLADYSPEEIRGVMARYFPVNGEPLELTEFTFPPDVEIRPHAHTASEIMYILKGEVRLGARACRAGTAVFIDEMVLYGFKVGPEGVTFLNFRGETGSRFVTKVRYTSMRQGEV
jgi:hypothetical protein